MDDVYRDCKLTIFEDGEVWVNTYSVFDQDDVENSMCRVKGITKHFRNIDEAKQAIDEYLDEKVECSNCEGVFNKYQMYHHMVGLVCTTCNKSKELQDFVDEEAREHYHQERQWEAYRRGWPIYEDEERQRSSNQIMSKYD